VEAGPLGGEVLGDEAAFCRKFAPRLLLWGRRHLRDRDAAADLAQDVLVAVLLALREGRVREPDRIGAYVIATARRMALHAAGVRARREGLLERFVAELVGQTEAEEAGADLARLGDCLTKLPDRDRQVVHFTFFEDHGSEQIAAVCGTTTGNVRVIRHRALERLPQCLEQGGHE